MQVADIKKSKKPIRIVFAPILIVFTVLFIGLLSVAVIQQTGATPEGITYFNCTFSDNTTYYNNYEPFDHVEPSEYIPEKGLWNWVNTRPPSDPEGWEVYAGSIYLVPDPAGSALPCARFILDAPGDRPLPTSQHCKLYEVQYTNRANYAETYSTLKEAYYQFKIWVPSSIDVQNSILLWQMCGDLSSYGVLPDADSPQLMLSFVNWGGTKNLVLTVSGFYYDDFVSGVNSNRFFPIISTADFPKDQWVTMTMFAKQGSTFRAENGTLAIWINSNKVFEDNTLPTASYSGTPYFIWGIGWYGSTLELLNQTVYFKDVSVTSYYPLYKVHSIFGIEVYNGTKIFGIEVHNGTKIFGVTRR